MATVNFYLDKADSKGLHPIFLVYQSQGRKFKFPIKEKVLIKYWDKKKQRVKHTSAAPEINDLMEHYGSKLKKVERELRMSDGGYSFDKIKSTFLNKKEEKLELFKFLEKTVVQLKSTHHNRTIMKYQTLINDLKEYEKKYKTILSFKKIDFDFCAQFIEFLTEEKSNSQNTVAKKISTLKTLLTMATKARMNTNLDYQEFPVKRVSTEKVYLTNDELFRLYNLDLSKNKKLEKTRDIFCFGCFTGLRYSDIETLKYENIISKNGKENEVIKSLKIFVQKTKDPLIIPLNKYALSILEKYELQYNQSMKSINANPNILIKNTQVFPTVSIQKMNDYIKELAKLASIDTPIQTTKYIGLKRIDETFPKYQLLATHSARRTFAVLSLERGMRIEVVQKILGHKSIRTTMKYVFIQEDVKADEMGKAWG